MQPQPKRNPQERRGPGTRPAQLASGTPRGRAHRAQPRTVYPRPRGKSRRGPAGVALRIDTPQGPKTSGFIRPEGSALEYFRAVRSSAHLLYALDAFGVDAPASESFPDKGVECIHLLDTDTETHYRVSVDYFLRHSVVRDFGHGRQRFLARRHWSQALPGQLQLLPG